MSVNVVCVFFFQAEDVIRYTSVTGVQTCALPISVVGELGDVDEAVLSRHHLDKGSKRHDANHLALVDPADLDLVGEALDPVDGLLAALLVDRRDEDTAVVLDVDLSTGFLGDLADHLASGADDVADL